ncbi:MAG: uroporphyrinogen-III synthase [Planctomycetes bacterium]|nr:uroporphyrinogen-III synthase [Planctomycetota bacterium]
MTVASGPGPLAGRRIVLTRARGENEELALFLAELGATTIEFPAIRIADPADWAPVDAAIGRLGSYDWLAVTSANGAGRFLARLAARGLGLAAFPSLALAAVGPATARALGTPGRPILISRGSAEGLARELALSADIRGRRVLFPRAERAREELPAALRAAGADVDEVVVYRTVPDESAPAGELARESEAGGTLLVVFSSPSAVRSFAGLFGEGVLAGAPYQAAAIGPTTSAAIRELGGRVAIEAAEPSARGLADAIRAFYTGEKP